MAKVAILYIGIGKYIDFWHGFYESMERFFLPKSQKDYFVFTDTQSIDYQECNNVHKIEQENLGWPGNTLYRFRMFVTIKEELEKFDYVFFINANTVCLREICEDEMFHTGEDLIIVRHPGYWNKKAYEFPYERRKKSLAYMAYTEGNLYAFGAINGGKSKAYIEMIVELSKRIVEDEKNHIIAVWHDESHLNRYVYEKQNIKILSPLYAYPEDCPLEWDIQGKPKIMLLDKKKYIALPPNKIKTPNKCMVFINNRKKKIQIKYWELYYKYVKKQGC